jgi:hypothetical protein
MIFHITENVFILNCRILVPPGADFAAGGIACPEAKPWGHPAAE